MSDLISKKKLLEKLNYYKIGAACIEGQKWYDQALQDIIDYVIDSGSCDLNINNNEDQSVIGRIFNSDLMRKQRFKLYGNAYEQGRFDEWIDREYGLGRYEDKK